MIYLCVARCLNYLACGKRQGRSCPSAIRPYRDLRWRCVRSALFCREHIVVFQQQWVTAGEPPENRLTARLQKPLADPSVGFVGSVLSSVELTLHSEYGHLRSIRSLDSRARLNFRQCQMKCFRCLTHYIIDQYVLQLYHFDPFCQYFAYVFS